MPFFFRAAVLLNLFFALLATCGPVAAAADPAPRTVTLAEAIDLAMRNNGELAYKMTGLDMAAAHEAQARAAAFPKLIGTGILSPIYESRGDALHSVNNLDRWGVWFQSTVTILQPFFTWGKLTDLREAAGHGTVVARAQLRKDTDELVFNVKQLYYGAILAEQARSFLDDGLSDIKGVLRKAEADQQKKRPSIAKRDYFRLKIFSAEAEYRFAEADKLRVLARHALSLNLGLNPDEETLPADASLSPIEAELPPDDELLHKMEAHRPEFEQLEHGIAAKEALLAAERTNLYPMFFVGGLLSFAYSNVRDGQQSAYAYDPYNRSTGGAGVGFQWTWDVATTLANEQVLRAEINELEKKQSFARSGFRLELRKSTADLREARIRLAASRDAFQIGKHWLTSESMGYSIGVGEIKNLIDAYLARAKTATDYWDAIYRVNMAWAALTRTIGLEVTPGMATPGATTN